VKVVWELLHQFVHLLLIQKERTVLLDPYAKSLRTVNWKKKTLDAYQVYSKVNYTVLVLTIAQLVLVPRLPSDPMLPMLELNLASCQSHQRMIQRLMEPLLRVKCASTLTNVNPILVACKALIPLKIKFDFALSLNYVKVTLVNGLHSEERDTWP
jgi:hypothetical protein